MRFRRMAAIVAMLLVAGGSAWAAAPSEYGWWWKAQQMPTLMIPAPPFVPTDGLFVANDPSGATAVSALRYTAAGGGAATLQLVVAQGSLSALADQVVACPTDTQFLTTEAGLWANAPKVDCDRGKVAGAASTDGTAVVWELPSAFELNPGTWGIALTPDPASQVPFQIAFNPPAGDSFRAATQGTAPPPPPAPARPTAPTASVPSGAGQAAGEGGPGPLSPSGAAPEVEPQPVAAAPVPPSSDASPSAPAVRSDLRDRIIAAAVFGVIALALWLAWVRQGESATAGVMARLIPRRATASGADSEELAGERGIGRFSRHRERPPRRLW
jgi:hypothetical protein